MVSGFSIVMQVYEILATMLSCTKMANQLLSGSPGCPVTNIAHANAYKRHRRQFTSLRFEASPRQSQLVLAYLRKSVSITISGTRLERDQSTCVGWV
jgi:hypothetical protein